MNSGGVVTLVAGVSVGCVELVQLLRIRRLRRTGVASIGTAPAGLKAT
jgi:hypothetical protein